jgi:hypothetical protein
VTTAEMLLRLLAAALCWLAGTALVLSVVAERRGPLAAALLLVSGTITVGVVWSYGRAAESEVPS